MKSSVVIKGCKSGMTVILNPDTPFEQLLEDVGKKFKESEKFWGSAQMTLTLEGRELTPIEELQVTDAITANSQIEILCLLDTDANRIARCEKALTERLMELTARTGQFYKGNLSRGDLLESDASIVIIGDVERGARVSARGNIVVLGTLAGSAHAGAAGSEDAVITALEMSPMHLRIADLTAKTRSQGKKMGRGPMIASVSGGNIDVESVKKKFFRLFSFYLAYLMDLRLELFYFLE
ncbi:septum site-determining protein MinC [Clostridium sp. AF21-20LB]|uniref:septum site-determining protein MinC n=1 Tax=Clostridium sp. AF21-20LB TaxID=2293003 RepID=UPI000E4AFA2B|nr:septum site-determining protein MinC [Clostridium sp. AF21-20LB]